MKSVQPALQDSLGNELAPRMDMKMVNYIGLIPVLIAGHQEQHAELEAAVAQVQESADSVEELREQLAEQRSRMDQLEALLVACCNNPDRATLQHTGIGDDALLNTDSAADRKLRIVPNPFSEPPTVFYTLDRGGRMQLFANSADGKELRVLHEAALQAGEYQFAWDTSALAPGMYYVTLLLDGQTLVKKAVKVDR